MPEKVLIEIESTATLSEISSSLRDLQHFLRVTTIDEIDDLNDENDGLTWLDEVIKCRITPVAQ